MGRRGKRRRQQNEFWIAQRGVAASGGASFYEWLNQLRVKRGSDEFVEALCERFHAEAMGRPLLTPGRYFRLLLMVYFEGLDGECGIVWRAKDSLALRRFLTFELSEQPPDHSTPSRTRRLIDRWSRIKRCSAGRWSCWRKRESRRARPSASMPQPWKRTQPSLDCATRHPEGYEEFFRRLAWIASEGRNGIDRGSGEDSKW